MPIKKEEGNGKKILFSVIIGFFLLSSIVGFAFNFSFNTGIPQNTPTKISGIEFFNTATGIFAEIDGRVMQFTYFPDELENTDIADTTTRITERRLIYVTSDVNSSMATLISGAEFDIAKILEDHHTTFTEIAFTGENSFSKSIISCNDASSLIPVMFFNFTNTTSSVVNNNNCITINFANENSLNRIRDKIIYELLGIEP